MGAAASSGSGSSPALSPAEQPVLVIGLGHVGVAVVHRLHALGVPVLVLLTPSEVARHGSEMQTLGVGIIAGSPVWDNDLSRLDFQSICAVILAADSDAANVDACLLIRKRTPDTPILVRVSDPTLVRFLRMSIPHVEPYSMGSVIAPVAAEMALQLLGKTSGRPLIVRPMPTWAKARAWLSAVLVASIALHGAAAAVLAHLLASRGHGGPTWLDVSAGLLSGWQWPGMDHALSGQRMAWVALAAGLLDRVALIAAAALLVDWLLPLRLTTALSTVAASTRGHIVVLGAGNIGARVAEILFQRRIRVVVIERDPNHKNVQSLRSLGLQVVVGDATVDETLDLAAAWNASAVLALTNSDAVNLHVGLLMSDRKIGVPTVVRLLSPELNEHTGRALDLTPISPVAETASYLCKAVERLRGDRGRVREPLQAGAPTPDPMNRPTGRYAGVEFDAGRASESAIRNPTRTPSSPRVPSTPASAVTPRSLPSGTVEQQAAKSAAGESAETPAAASGTGAVPSEAPKTGAGATGGGRVG